MTTALLRSAECHGRCALVRTILPWCLRGASLRHTSRTATLVLCTARRWIGTNAQSGNHTQLSSISTSPHPCMLGYLDPVPSPPPIHTALFRWAIASSILALGTCIELPLLITWRILHTLSSRHDNSAPSLLRRVNHSVLSLSYQCRIRYCYHVLRALHVTLRVVNRNTQPFALDSRPHLFVQLNQHSLLEPLCFHAASYIEYQRRKQRGQRCDVLGLLSTPHFFINVEYGLWPLLGWVQAFTAVVVVRQYKQQARTALDRMIRRMSSHAHLVSAEHPSADIPAASSPPPSSFHFPSLWPDSFYISPEGGRSSSPSLQPYRTGTAIAAISAGALVVPVIMRGVRQCLPKGAWRVRGGVCEVLYDEVIESRGLRYEDRQLLTATIRRRYEYRLSVDVSERNNGVE